MTATNSHFIEKFFIMTLRSIPLPGLDFCARALLQANLLAHKRFKSSLALTSELRRATSRASSAKYSRRLRPHLAAHVHISAAGSGFKLPQRIKWRTGGAGGRPDAPGRRIVRIGGTCDGLVPSWQPVAFDL